MTDAPRFSVPVADLEYGDRNLSEEIPLEWLKDTFAETEAVPDGPGWLDVTLSKNGREVMVRGEARAKVTVPCARTLDPVSYALRAEVFLLLEPKAPAQAPVRHEKARKKPAGQGGERRRAREEERVLSESDAARDTYDGEKVVLDPFLREFLVLEIPMFPLREDLRSEATPAIERPPVPAETGHRTEAVDPRLAPLADIAKRLREKKE